MLFAVAWVDSLSEPPRSYLPDARKETGMLPAHVAGEAALAVPRPLLFGLFTVLLLAVTVVVVYVGARVGYRAFKLLVRPVRRVLTLVLPEGSATVVAAALVVTAGVGTVSFLVLEADSSLGEGGGAGGRAGEFLDRGLREDPVSDISGDVYSPAAGLGAPEYDRPMPDTDGDRLKDSWERDGETRAGVPLPGADPMHKDVYVVFHYGDRYEPLTPEEKRVLVADWARMPVSNPDGDPGIDLHVVDAARPIRNDTISVGESQEGALGAYGELGDGRCRYHLVTLASFEGIDPIGLASGPGYTSLVEGTVNTSYDRVTNGSRTRRVHVTTHELLHNVAGVFDGGEVHTDEGWLYPKSDPAETHLSPTVRNHLSANGIQGSGYVQQNVCGTETPTPA